MRYLAIDHGGKRTGLAVSDAAGTLATPHSVIETANESYLMDCIQTLAQRECIEAVVLGLPLNMDGTEGTRARRVRDFGQALGRRLELPVYYHDERLSSFAADSLFMPGQMTRQDKKKRMDAVAAAVILQAFLEARQNEPSPPISPRIVRTADPDALAETAARMFVESAREAVSQRGVFYVAVSGGSTPGRFFKRLAEPKLSATMPWEKLHLFWADERCVPPDSADSNYRLAMDTFLAAAAVGPSQIHRIHGEYGDPVRAADAYQGDLRAVFGMEADGVPCFDLIVLGLGRDGHIASLMPGDPGVQVTEDLTWPVFRESNFNRVTLTGPVLRQARQLMVQVCGAEKAEIVHTIFSVPPDADRYPVHLLWPVMEHIVWLLDEAAAADL